MIFTNAIAYGDSVQAEQLINLGVIDLLIESFDIQVSEILTVVLNGVNNILYKGIEMMQERKLDVNPVMVLLEKKNLSNHLQVLVEYPHEEVSSTAIEILEHFYNYNQEKSM